MKSLNAFLIMASIIAGVVQARTAFCEQDAKLNRETPIVRVYRKTHKAVVNISGERTTSTSVLPGFDWPEMFDMFGPRVKRQVKVLGSGVIVHQAGYVLTNAHVIKGAKAIKIGFSDGTEHNAEVVSADDKKDLAVLRVDANEPLPYVNLGTSGDLLPGETVIAIGNPYGYTNTVTTGIVSAIGRDIKVAEGYWLRGLIQTDAPINPGNSGGPLLNINGQLIGVTTAIRAEAQNIGFAIPVDSLLDNLSHMLMPEKLRRASLGITIGRMENVSGARGLEVQSVTKPSPAAEKGIQKGDIILQMSGQKVTSIIDFYVKLMDKETGSQIQVTYVRPASGQARHSVNLTLKAKPLPDGQKLARTFFQMKISKLTDKVARKFDFDSAYPVLIVTKVEPRGMAARAAIEAGDIILEIDGHAVSTLKDLAIRLENISDGDIVQFRIMRVTAGFFGQVQRQFIVRLRANRGKLHVNTAKPKKLQPIAISLQTGTVGCTGKKHNYSPDKKNPT